MRDEQLEAMVRPGTDLCSALDVSVPVPWILMFSLAAPNFLNGKDLGNKAAIFLTRARARGARSGPARNITCGVQVSMHVSGMH